MKKFIHQSFAALCCLVSLNLTLTSCENFYEGDKFIDYLTQEIEYSKAESVTVTVNPVSLLHGQITSGSPVTAKIGYPFTVNFIVDDAYNFEGWAAYSNFSSIDDTPLSTEYVEFYDEDGNGPGKSLKCRVTIKKKTDNIYLIPLCRSKPAVTLTEPLAAEKDVTITTPIKISFNKKMDLTSIIQKDNNGNIIGFKNFKVTYSKSEDDNELDTTGDVTDYFDAENTVLKKNGTQIVIPFKNKLDSTKWLPAASFIRVDLGADIAADSTEGGTLLDSTYSWTFITGTNADVKGPVISSASLSLKNNSSEKIIESESLE